MPSCSKAPRGLFVQSWVTRIFTGTSISPGPPSRQRPDRYTIRAGRNFTYSPVSRSVDYSLISPLVYQTRYWRLIATIDLPLWARRLSQAFRLQSLRGQSLTGRLPTVLPSLEHGVLEHRNEVGLLRYQPVTGNYSYPTRNFATLGPFMSLHACACGLSALRIATEIGPYHHCQEHAAAHLILATLGVWSLRILSH